MATLLQGLRHLQHCTPQTLGPSNSQTARVSHRQPQTVAAARGRRAVGDTLSEQLADLLPEHAAAAVERTRGGGGRRKSTERQNAPKQQTIEEEDVEIFSIDSGWSEAAFASPDELAAVIGSLSGGGGTSSAAAAQDVGAAAAMDAADGDLVDLELEEWALEGFDQLGEAASEGDEFDDGATSWATDNYDFDSDDEVEGLDAAIQIAPDAEGDDWSAGAGAHEEEDDGWTVTAVSDDYEVAAPPERHWVDKASQGSAAMREPQISPALQQLLDSMPPAAARRLARGEAAAAAESSRIDPRSVAKAEARRKTHRQLRIISGTAGGKRLLSPQGDVTRPMMEMVRAAVFSMIHSRTGGAARLPEGSRWLDLFAGTGSIGLEALSRGCRAAVFVELDPWVTKACLQANIDSTSLRAGSTVMTMKAESFLERSVGAPSFAGGAFDFISVCPPYLLVSYPQLFDLLEASPLTKPTSIILVEYPKRLAHQIPNTLCGLPKVRDRRYGRTFLALYAPAEDDGEAGDGVWEAYV